MIVYERKHDFVLVEQCDHACLSAELFAQLREDLFDNHRRSDVCFAIRNHDRAWAGLDATPLWNDAENVPYSFIDLPTLLKLPHYQHGIDWVERSNKYAALLCSQHYASFFIHSNDDAEREFFQHELRRQNRLRFELGGISEKENSNHLGVLKLFDYLSIYICINELGVSKDHEFPGYRDGFQGTEQLFDANDDKIAAHWLTEKSVGLSVEPFQQRFTVSVPTKSVSKDAIREFGIARAYGNTPVTIRTVEIVAYPGS